ncbi:MAG: DUF4136 domain-containing protein, partial [bacterium]
DFDAYKTFSFMYGDTESMNLTEKWKQADQDIREAIIREMAAKGVNYAPNDPELMVVYSLGMRDKMGRVDFNADYSVDRTNADIYREGGGVLVIDLVDAKTNHLVWRGEAKGALNVDPSPEIMEKNINRAVSKVLDKYPPNTKSAR